MVVRDRNADGNTTTGTGGLEERVYAIQDANWNTTAIIAAAGVPGVAAGAVVNRFIYAPYGRSDVLTAAWATAGASTPTPWAHRFQGLEFTDVTNLFHARNRDYSFALGRFIQLDPIGFSAGDSNWYRFVGNGPTGKVDPSGLWAWDDDWIELGLGGLLGLQGQQVQEEAGASIAGSWLFKAPGKISTVDPTPISGTVDTLLVGTLEGRSTKAMAAEIACEVMPGPNPRKAKRVVGAIDKCAAPVKGAFEIAQEGGKHAGFLNNSIGKPASQLQKGIRSLEKEIADHLDKIANPKKHIPGWDALDPRQKQALLNSKWPGDIARQREQLDILQGLLRRLGGGS
jgi:RHS repeat-associated protein